MKNSKNKKLFTYMVVGALVMALSISCKSNEEPKETGSTSTYHPSQGSYTNTVSKTDATVKINDDGTCTITGKASLISGSTNEQTDFSITVTKWWYYYDSPNTYNAGSPYEKSEATITKPANDYFYVSYYTDSGVLCICFDPEVGKRYYTGDLKKVS